MYHHFLMTVLQRWNTSNSIISLLDVFQTKNHVLSNLFPTHLTCFLVIYQLRPTSRKYSVYFKSLSYTVMGLSLPSLKLKKKKALFW